ncbi:MAG: flagellar filament capping protein FliD [Dissulfurispiraceae bacterium]|jgi:flagellar hook-associated protein 2|nr:flagellar filament capping protein FliD [Dissulfurispiraceae bacterium]
MAITTSLGVSSGIDYNALVNGLMAIERQPLNKLKTDQSAYNSKISVYSELSSRLSALKEASDALKTASNFYVKKAAVSDTSAASATVTNSTSSGSYTLEVSNLAQAHQITHKAGLADKDETAVLLSGGSFQFTINGETKTITAESDMTLEDLAAEINSQTYTGSVKAQATVINTGTSTSPSYKLVLTSNTTGSDYGMTIDNDDSVLNLDETSDTGNGQYRDVIQSALNASFKLNGLTIERSSNTFSDVVSGMTISLKKGASNTTITVDNDTTAIQDRINNFAAAYNNVVNYISSQSAYDSSTKAGGALMGESTSRAVLSSLSSMLTARVAGASEDMRALSQIGFKTDSKTGTVSVDSATLAGALSNSIDKVAELFTSSDNGIASKFYDYTDSVTKSNTGAISIRTTGLQNRINDIAQSIIKMESRLARTEDSLVARFAALESLLSGLSAQSSYLTNLFNSM